MSLPSEPKSMIRSAAPKVAVVGCEHWGRDLVRNHHDLADVIQRPPDAGLVLMVGHLLELLSRILEARGVGACGGARPVGVFPVDSLNLGKIRREETYSGALLRMTSL